MAMIKGQPIIHGQARGLVLTSSEPLSFWGGYDWQTGEVIDRRHPLSGRIAAGCILAVPFTRGSSTTTAVLLESIKAGTAPAAIVTLESDFFFALASVVADEMYATPVPLIVIAAADFASLRNGDQAEVGHDGTLTIHAAK
jgi:predicted aconitase with swiveling domain